MRNGNAIIIFWGDSGRTPYWNIWASSPLSCLLCILSANSYNFGMKEVDTHREVWIMKRIPRHENVSLIKRVNTRLSFNKRQFLPEGLRL